MSRERYELVLGTFLLVLGVVILISVLVFAFGFIPNAGKYFEEQLPQEEIVQGPSASFTFRVDNLTVEFTDTSDEGDAGLVSWEWDFGDGDASNDQNPTKVYSTEGHYTPKLTVEDDNRKRSSAVASDLFVGPGTQQAGSSMPDFGDFGFDFDLSKMLLPLALAILVVGLHFVMVVVGGFITKAGWNLIKPKPETIKVRVKPKDLEVEPIHTAPVQQAAAYQPAQRPEQTVPPQVQPQEGPPPPPQE
ncbi:MAG: PKD domain-containing protein [Thermoplasmata archaeon]